MNIALIVSYCIVGNMSCAEKSNPKKSLTLSAYDTYLHIPTKNYLKRVYNLCTITDKEHVDLNLWMTLLTRNNIFLKSLVLVFKKLSTQEAP